MSPLQSTIKAEAMPLTMKPTIKITANAKSSAASLSLLSQSKTFARQQWQKASDLLQTNPTLMTQPILCLALKHRPPLHVVEYMLQCNPKAASIPNSGPTPLQIAVQNSCSVDVIKVLLEACPLALVTSNPGSSHLDPLSYAKRFRADETDLIEVLSLPLSHWIGSKPKIPPKLNIAKTPKPPVPLAETDIVAIRPRALPSLLDKKMDPSVNGLSAQDRQELNNIKMLCLTVLKGHRKLVTDYNNKDNIHVDRHGFLQNVQTNQDQQFRTQLIAMDMKEQAMRVHMRRMERRIIQGVVRNKKEVNIVVEAKCQAALQNMQETINALQQQVRELQARPFEGTPSQREGTSAASLMNSRCERDPPLAKKKAVVNTPIVFATPCFEDYKEDDDDEVRSLLTEDSFVLKKKHLSNTRRTCLLRPFAFILKP